MNVAHTIHKLWVAVYACNLFARNWSGNNKILLAVYGPDSSESFLGTVAILDGKAVIDSKHNSKRETKYLAEVCERFNGT